MQLFKLRISFGIFFFVAWQVMPTSVEFNDYSCACNIKINDKIPDILLSVYRDGQSFQKIIPKMFFLRCHSLAECLRGADELFVVIVDHCYSIARQRSAKVGWMIPAPISAKASAVTAPVQTAAKSTPALIAVFISVTLSPT